LFFLFIYFIGIKNFSTCNTRHAFSAFSLAARGAKKKLTKRNADEYFALCGGRGGLHALHLCELLKSSTKLFLQLNI